MRARAAFALLLALALPAPAAELGTLLTTPQERERLDRLRRGEPESHAEGRRAARNEITGFVRRSDGRGTIWVDGVPRAVDARRADKLLEQGALRSPDIAPERLRIERRATR